MRRHRSDRLGRTRRALTAAAALALLLALLAAGIGPAGAAPGQDEPDPATEEPAEEPDEAPATDDLTYERLAACVGSTDRLLAVLLVDESASLQNTDPDGVRVAALKRALDGLLALTTTTDTPPSVDVLMSVFSFDFQPISEWTPLDAASHQELTDLATGLAERDKGMDTDMTNALAGAREALSERSVATGVEGAGVCKLVLLFTDGRYDIGVRETPAQLVKFGRTKDYAPGVVLDTKEGAAEARTAGLAALCDPDGVADQVRSDDITLLTVALAAELRPEDEEFLAALTRGEAGETTCGARDGTGQGAYVAAEGTEALIATFDGVATRLSGGSPSGPPVPLLPCADEGCAGEQLPFAVDSSLRQLHLFVTVPDEESTLVLIPPVGDRIELDDREPRTEQVAGAEVAVAWPSPTTATIDIRPAEGSTEGFGDWKVELRGGTEGLVQASVFTDIVAALIGVPVVQVGEESRIEATVVGGDGESATDLVSEARITAVITDPVKGSTTELDLESEGEVYAGTYTATDDLTVSFLRIVLRLRAVTVDGVELSSNSDAVVLNTRRPPGYALVGPPELVLSSVERLDEAEGFLVVSADGERPTCAWVDEPKLDSQPEDLDGLESAYVGLATTEDGCTDVLPGEPVTLDVRFRPTSPASGSVTGVLRLWSTDSAGDALPVDVPFRFEMTRGVDTTKRLVLAVGLLVAGILFPLLLLFVVNLFTTRFQSVDRVRGGLVPVVVRRNGAVMRVRGGPREDFRLYPEDFVSLAGSGGKREFSFADLVFRARAGFNPLVPGHAVAAPEGGAAAVAREGRRVSLDLSLAGSWIFLYDPDATDDASVSILGGVPDGPPPEIHGRVVAFIAEGEPRPQIHRLQVDLLANLVGTAERMAELARAGDAYKPAHGSARKGGQSEDEAEAESGPEDVPEGDEPPGDEAPES